MSTSQAIQDAIYQRLISDDDVSAIVGNRVIDGSPAEYPCITFGPTDFFREDDAESCVTGRTETVQLDCWVREGQSLRPTKALADAVVKSLHRAPINMVSGNHLVQIEVDGVRVFMDRDGLTGHGVVTVQAMIDNE